MRFTGWMMLIVSVVSIVWGGFVGNWAVFGNANDCLSIVSDGSALWLGTSGGVVRYEPSGNYNIYTTLDGLGALKISSLTVDSNGYVWYVSENGYVGAFVDGMWRTADELAQNFYELNKIRYYNGHLWIASNKGIVRAKPVPTSFTVVQFEEYIEHFSDFPSQIAVNDIEFFHDTVFVATEYGIAFAPVDANLINPAVWETAAVWDTIPEGGVISRGVKALGVYHDTLWILAVIQNSGDHSLYYFDGSHISKKTLVSSFSRDANEICSAADTMWIVDETGVFFYFQSDNNMVRVSVDAPLMGAREVTECSGKVYFATRYGIGWTEGGRIEVLAFNSMYGSAISDVVFPGNTAVVAAPGCVNIFDGTHWSFLDYYTYYLSVSDYPSSTLNTIRVIFGLLRSAIITPDGVLWLGSYGSGLLKIYPDSSFEIWNDTTSCLATSGSAPHYTIANRFRLDPAGNLWVVSYQSNDNKPIKVWTPDKYNDPYGAVDFGLSDGVPHKEVRAIACGRDRVAVATAYGAAVIYHQGTIADKSDDYAVSLVGLLPSDEVNATAITPDGRVWFGTGDGLAYWDPGGYVTEVPMPEELSATVVSLAADSMGNLWIATLDGAALLTGDGYFSTFKSFHSDDAPVSDRTPLLDDAVGIISASIMGGVYTDGKSGNVWFGFNDGLVLLRTPYSADFAPDSLVIYPNPAVAQRGILPPIYVGNIPYDAPLLIYDSAGNLVREIAHYWKGHDGFIMWDGRNSAGEPVAPGVYSIVAPSEQGILKGKIFIVR